MAYIDHADVAVYLQRSLTEAEEAAVTAAIDAACARVDRYTGFTWVGTTVTGEIHTVYGPYVWLKRRPVATVTSVTHRSLAMGADPVTLTAGTGYEILDASRGLLQVAASCEDLLTVSYTVTVDLPDEVKLATTILAAGMLSSAQATTHQGAGIKRYSIGGELSVEYADAADPGDEMPAAIRSLLAPYRVPVIV